MALLLIPRGVVIGNALFFTIRAGPFIGLRSYLHAVFDDINCRLYGTTVIPYIGARDEVTWAVENEGERLSGVFNIKVGDMFVFAAICMQTGTYSGEATDDSILSVLANAGYPYLNTTDVLASR